MTFSTRVVAIAFALLLPVSVVADEDSTLVRAAEWLVSQQNKNGAWTSKHYGAMKQGAALTSLVVYSLSVTPESVRKKYTQEIDDAFEFLKQGTLDRNRVANPDGSLDHPVYSTSMYLTASSKLGRKLPGEQIAKLLEFLVASQCTEERGFQDTNPNYGGWDVIGPDVFPGKTSGTNVSATRFVLEAFDCYVPVGKEASVGLSEQTIQRVRKSQEKAKKWLERLHAMNDDGGFRFSAQPNSALNKSRTDSGEVRSYGSATCDGLLGLYYSGMVKQTQSIAAEEWLRDRASAAKVPGFENTESESSWPAGIRFYYLQSLSRACLISADRDWATDLNKKISLALAQSQEPDGSFRNESALMSEDDPIIATSFAVIALSQNR